MTSAMVSHQLGAIVALGAGTDPMLVEAAVSGSPGLEVTGFLHDFDPAGGGLDQLSADVFVVAFGHDSWEEAAVLIGEFTRRYPSHPVIALASGSPNGFVSRVIEAGAHDIVRLPEMADAAALEEVGEQIAFALQKAAARREGAALARAATDGRLICVLGPKGGIGKTLTAANLAVTFAEDGHSAVVVDLDLQFGDVGLTLGLTPEKTIYDLARSSGSMDAEKVEAFMAEHVSGARALLAPTRPDQASAVTPEFLTTVYSALRSVYEYVVVDTPPGFTPEVIASIDSASDICMVGTLDTLSLKNTKLGLETLELMGYPSERVQIVLNRADSRVGIAREDVGSIIGREADIFVPSSREIARSVNESAPIAMTQPRSEAGRAFRSLAAMYGGQVAANGAAPETNGRRRAFRRPRS